MGFLKDIATAFKPSSIKQGLDAARNPQTAEEREAALASLTPEQRAKYEANMAEVEAGMAESQASWQEAREIEDSVRPLWGPAGDYVYGPTLESAGSPEDLEAKAAAEGIMSVVRDQRAKNKGQFKTGVRQSFGINEVDQIDDPALRAEVAASERAARDAARAPYRATEAVPVAFDRIATRGKTQVAELLDHAPTEWALRPTTSSASTAFPTASARRSPRTPRRGGSSSGRSCTRRRRPVRPRRAPSRRRSWPRSSGSPDGSASRRCLTRTSRWPSACRPGSARSAASASRGSASSGRSRGEGSEDSAGPIRTLVNGVIAIHPEEASGTFEQLMAAAPLPLPLGGERGIHVEVLNWDALARAVHLKINHPHPVPSPFPYLPATPGELLAAYLEVVGVQPADCYSAQATVDSPMPLMQGGFMSTNLGPSRCAPTARRGCGRTAATTSSSPTATGPSTPPAASAGPRTSGRSSRRGCATACACARRSPCRST